MTSQPGSQPPLHLLLAELFLGWASEKVPFLGGWNICCGHGRAPRKLGLFLFAFPPSSFPPGLGLCWNWASLGSCTCGGLRCSYLSAWGPSVLSWLRWACSAGGLARGEERLPYPQPGTGMGLGQLLIPQMFSLQ